MSYNTLICKNIQILSISVGNALAIERCDKTELIDILAKARHGTRESARRTGVIFLADETI